MANHTLCENESVNDIQNAQTREARKVQALVTLEALADMPFPGLACRADGDSVAFIGTKENFRASGLVPAEAAFPDECNAKRGVRWQGAGNRRYVLSRGWGPADHFRLVVHATPEEKRAKARLARKTQEVKEIDRELLRTDIREAEYRARMERHILLGWSACRSELQGGEAWTYDSEVIEAIQEKVSEIRELLRFGTVCARPGAVQALKARKAALQDMRLQKLLANITSSART